MIVSQKRKINHRQHNHWARQPDAPVTRAAIPVLPSLNRTILSPDIGLEIAVRPGRVVIAGPGHLGQRIRGDLPTNLEVRQRLIRDDEALDRFRRCGLVALPYLQASLSARVTAAYAFCKPVVLTRTGALPEYVVAGETGWVVPPGDAKAPAAVREAWKRRGHP
jgi:glycosyltransferase involved in cell wall biosynthesis